LGSAGTLYRSVTDDFLLTFHSNHGPISYRFRDKRIFSHFQIFRFSVENRKLFIPRVFCASAKGVPLELSIVGGGGQKTRMMGILGRQRSLTISSVMWIQYTNVTDRRTDVHKDTGRQQRPRLRIASRSKKIDRLNNNKLP